MKRSKKSVARKSVAKKSVAKKSHVRSSTLALREAVVTKPTLVHMNSQGRLTLPASARRTLGLEGEADLQLDLETHALVLKPTLVLAIEDAWAYTTEHRELLKRAHADSRGGRVRSVSERELDHQA
jgi:bifunctional DNA-binding transcriptional regulator/antitoxin component of YhaV-PrlF toxin-antitoxin module